MSLDWTKEIKARKHVLLTGAGFTKNFGGLLGSEMWAEIFNNPKIQGNQILRMAFQPSRDPFFNYENIYDDVMTDENFRQPDRATFTQSLLEAYKKMDKLLVHQWLKRHQEENSPERPFDINVANFLKRFAGISKERGYFFTLNQDLFIERYMISKAGAEYWNGGTDFVYPGGDEDTTLALRPRVEY